MTVKKLQNLSDMFGAPASITGDDSNALGVTVLEIENLVPYRQHKFNLYIGDRLKAMVESIKEFGVIIPIVVRPIRELGVIMKYEIISGHNRVHASKLAGKTTIKAIIYDDLNDEDAEWYVSETNLLQRGFEELSFSERVSVLYERYNNMKQQGRRSDLLKDIEYLSSIGTETYVEGHRSDKIVGKAYNLSPRMISRYVKLVELNKDLMKRLDSGEISFVVAVSLAFLKPDEQRLLEDTLVVNEYTIDAKKAELLKQFSEKRKLTEENICQILSGKLDKKVSDKKSATFKIKPTIIKKFFSTSVTSAEVEETIEKALDLYFSNQGEDD